MTDKNTNIDLFKLKTTFHPDHVVHTAIAAEGGLVGVKTTWKEVRRIGGGGFGSVGLEKGVVGGKEKLRAVKRLSRDFYRNVRIDFSREVRALIAVRDHQDLFVRFLGWYEDRYFVFIAMEYVEHGDLGQYLKDHRSEAKAHAKEITKQLLDALVILHERQICHRDLKPQNILVASTSPVRVKLADFGASKSTIGTKLRTQCGTQGYLAPETLGMLPRRFTQGKELPKALDVWSLGCVVHEVLAFETPFLERELGEGFPISGSMSSVQTSDAETGILLNDPETGIRHTDLELLSRFCSGDVHLPIEALKQSDVSERGIDFIKSLLVADPQFRMSAAGSLKHLWLSGVPFTQANASQAIEQLRSIGFPPSPKATEDFLLKCARFDEIDISLLLPDPSGNDLLFQAASQGHAFLLELLLEIRPSTEGLDFKVLGWTPLQSAAEAGHVDVVKLLLSRGADPNVEPAARGGRTALQAAAEFDNIEIVRLLLAHGANVNGKPCETIGRTALQAAAEGGYLEIAKLLLQNSANVNAEPSLRMGRTALQAAAESGDLEMVRLLLDNGADVNAKPCKILGRTALQAATEGGHLDAVAFLLVHSADVNAESTTILGRTALHAAVEIGNLEIAKLLLANGVNVGAEQAQSRNPAALSTAALRGDIEMVKLLLAYEADINATPSKTLGQTALQAAVEGGHVDVAELLLVYGANVNANPGHNRQTVLQTAAQSGNLEMVNLLLNHSASVNAKACDYKGRTALQVAAEEGHLDIVRLLLAHGANVNAEPANIDGVTALHAAMDGGYPEIEELLVSAGASHDYIFGAQSFSGPGLSLYEEMMDVGEESCFDRGSHNRWEVL